MRTITISILICLLAASTTRSQAPVRGKLTNRPVHTRHVEPLTSRPTLGVEYSSATQIKVASRKSIYRIGDMIGIDIAILNSSREVLFVHQPRLPGLRLTAQDSEGHQISISPYAAILEGVVPESYRLVRSNSILVGSVQMLAGCSSEELKEFEKSRERFDLEVHQRRVPYEKGLYDTNLFVNWGDFCARFEHAGTYTVTAEISNEHVLVSPAEPQTRTAVGTVRSSPIKITVVD